MSSEMSSNGKRKRIRKQGENWTKEEALRLIALVKLEPNLWDINCAKYADKTLRSSSWAKIEKEIGRYDGECLNKWTALRNNYRWKIKTLKNSKSGRESMENNDLPDPFPSMKFLQSVLTNSPPECKSTLKAKTASSSSTPIQTKHEYTIDNDASSNFTSEIIENIGSSSTLASIAKPKPRRSNKGLRRLALEAAFETIASLQTPPDNWANYGEFVGNSIREIAMDHPSIAQQLKMEITSNILHFQKLSFDLNESQKDANINFGLTVEYDRLQ